MTKKGKKQLTVSVKCDNICELSERRDLLKTKNRSEKRSKKSEKNPEKQLTNKSVCDRIDKLSETDGTLKRSSTRF